MHVQRRTIQLSLATFCTLSIFLIAGWWFMPTAEPLSPNQGIALHAPAFVNVAQAASHEEAAVDGDFLAQEAGFSAYMNTGSEINLEDTTDFFRSIAKRTDDFIVGPVISPSYEGASSLEETMDVQVYIHREGWIIAYLLKNQPVSMTFDWPAYKSSGLASTTLERTVRKIANGIGSTGDIWYYDFRYRNATNLMFIADMEEGHEQWDSFTLEIPSTFTVSEASFSLGAYNAYAEFKINEENPTKQACRGCWVLAHNKIELAPEFEHKINIYHHSYGTGHASYGGIALIYQEGQ